MESLSRRKLLGTAGVAAGAAAIAAAPPRAAALERSEDTDPRARRPEEAVIAIVRDVKRGEVTVMSGTREVTYRDRALVKRLLKARPGRARSRTDVLPPRSARDLQGPGRRQHRHATRSSARTSRTRSRSSPTTSRSRTRPAARTSSSSATTCSTRSTSTTTATAQPDVAYQFRFKTKVRNENTFLYNTGPITSIDSPNWNRRQFYDVTGDTEESTTTAAPSRRCSATNLRLPAVQHRAALDAELQPALGDAGGAHARAAA